MGPLTCPMQIPQSQIGTVSPSAMAPGATAMAPGAMAPKSSAASPPTGVQPFPCPRSQTIPCHILPTVAHSRGGCMGCIRQGSRTWQHWGSNGMYSSARQQTHRACRDI